MVLYQYTLLAKEQVLEGRTCLLIPLSPESPGPHAAIPFIWSGSRASLSFRSHVSESAGESMAVAIVGIFPLPESCLEPLRSPVNLRVPGAGRGCAVRCTGQDNTQPFFLYLILPLPQVSPASCGEAHYAFPVLWVLTTPSLYCPRKSTCYSLTICYSDLPISSYTSPYLPIPS